MLASFKPYWPQIALGLYILLTEVLAKIPKLRANTAFELFYNPIAKALRAIPFVGKFADLFDTPAPVAGAATAQPASEPASKNAQGGFVRVEMLLLIGLIGLGVTLLTCGCAPGADGLRQACTNADKALTGAYQTAAGTYASDQESLRAQLAANTLTSAQAETKLTAHKTIIDKVMATLDGLKASKTALCAAIPAVEAGQRKDTANLITAIGQIAAAIPAIVQSIAALTSYLEIPSEPIRMTRAEVPNV